MHCNADALRQYRVRSGWSQEKLAIMSGLNPRTIQRAEAGEPLSLETFSQISSALNVPLAEITGEAAVGQNDNDDGNVVVLRRCVSGVEVVNLLTKAYNADVSIEMEPDPEWVEDTASLLDEISDLSPNPWGPSSDVSLSDRLRRGAALTQRLQKIGDGGVGLFVGQYTALERIPRYDMDEGHYYVSDRFTQELVQYAVLRIAKATLDKMMIRVENKYIEIDDQIPF